MHFPNTRNSLICSAAGAAAAAAAAITVTLLAMRHRMRRRKALEDSIPCPEDAGNPGDAGIMEDLVTHNWQGF